MLNRFTKSIVEGVVALIETGMRAATERAKSEAEWRNMHPGMECASGESRISNPSTTTLRSVFPWASDTVVTKLFSLTALFLNLVSTQDGTLTNGQVSNCIVVRQSRAVSKWDAARRKGKDQDQSDQGLPMVARDTWQLLRYKEQSEQEHRMKYVKHFLSQKFNSLEEARKRGTLDEDEAYGVGKRAQAALQRLETTTKILDTKLQAGGRKRSAEPEQADGDVRRPYVQHHSEVKRCGALAFMLHVMAEMEECLKEYLDGGQEARRRMIGRGTTVRRPEAGGRRLMLVGRPNQGND